MPTRLDASDLAIGSLALAPVGENDLQVLACGLAVGQIMSRRRSFGRVVWFWSVSGPHIPETMALAGSNAQTLGGARQAVKRTFDAWLHTATGQPGNMPWSEPPPG